MQSGPDGDRLVGYACGTLSGEPVLTKESMARHDPGGALLCLHSVCVAAPERRRRVATRLLRAYAAYVQQTTPQLQELRLLSKPAMVPLYEGAGWELLGESSVVHGLDRWMEMRLGVEGPEGGNGAERLSAEQCADWT